MTKTPINPEPVLATLVRFGFAFLVLNVLLVGFFAVTGMSANAGVSIGALIGAALFAGQGFVRQHQRLPLRGEQSKLIFGSLAMSIVVSLLLVAGASVVLTGGLMAIAGSWKTITESVSAAFLLIATVTILLIYLVTLWISYGPLLGFIVRQQDKARQKSEPK